MLSHVNLLLSISKIRLTYIIIIASLQFLILLDIVAFAMYDAVGAFFSLDYLIKLENYEVIRM